MVSAREARSACFAFVASRWALLIRSHRIRVRAPPPAGRKGGHDEGAAVLSKRPKVLVVVLIAEVKRHGRRAGNQGLAGPRQESSSTPALISAPSSAPALGPYELPGTGTTRMSPNRASQRCLARRAPSAGGRWFRRRSCRSRQRSGWRPRRSSPRPDIRLGGPAGRVPQTPVRKTLSSNSPHQGRAWPGQRISASPPTGDWPRAKSPCRRACSTASARPPTSSFV